MRREARGVRREARGVRSLPARLPARLTRRAPLSPLAPLAPLPSRPSRPSPLSPLSPLAPLAPLAPRPSPLSPLSPLTPFSTFPQHVHNILMVHCVIGMTTPDPTMSDSVSVDRNDASDGWPVSCAVMLLRRMRRSAQHGSRLRYRSVLHRAPYPENTCATPVTSQRSASGSTMTICHENRYSNTTGRTHTP